MILNNSEILKEKIKLFWRLGDEIICTRIFRHSHNECYFCGRSPIEWHHVLLNIVTNQTIDVELSCVISMKKIMEELGSSQKILFFPQYSGEVDHINSQYQDTATIVEFNPNPDIILRLLSRPEELNYKQVRAILDHTVKFSDDFMTELFHSALDIYVNKKYYIYEMLDEHEKISNVDRSIEDYFRKEWERVKSEAYEYESTSYKVKIKDNDCPF